MNQNICNICGANYEYVDGRWKCPACGAYKEEELSNEEVTLLYHAAQKLRLNAFDEAEEAYRDITVRYPQNSNGWWGLVLAKYGIKYEQDYDGKMLPTCYAASYDSLLSDKNYQTALSLANAENRAYYEAQASKIESIRREWVEKAAKEPPVDIFLSYKDTELENGVERTDDSHEAFELYTHLKELGYHVFYSRETLKDKTGEKYEPYIFNALNTAKVMLVYGSKPEYISSTWVKNEWSRFYKRIKQGQKQPNAMAVVYRGFNPASLPRPLSSVQSMDRDSMTFLHDLDAYVKRVVSASVVLPHIERVEVKTKARAKAPQIKTERKAVETRQIGTVSTPTLTANAEKLLAVGYAYLNGGQFAEALQTFEAFLINQPNNGRALLGKMLVLSECKNINDFSARGVVNFRDFNLLSEVLKTVEKGDGEAILRAFCEEVKRNAKEKNFARAKEIFEQIVSYDSQSVIETRSQLFDIAILHLKEKSEIVSYFLETDLLYENDENAYIRKLLAVARQARKDGLFDLSIEYIDRALEKELDSADLHIVFLWEKLCAEMQCRFDSQLTQSIVNLSNFETLEDAVALDASNEVFLPPLLRACVEHIKQNGKKADQKAFSAFEKLLTYIPKEQDNQLLIYLQSAAATCKSVELFEQAERYYAMMLDIDSESHDTYWGLLQAKLHCVTDVDLIHQNVPLSEMQEFNNALLCAGSNSEVMSHDIEVQAKQKAWSKRLAKRKKARKVLSVIAAAMLLVVLVVFAGTRYYQSENQLKFKLTDDGYTVSAGRFYSANGELIIPKTYNGVAVTAIAEKAFYDQDNLTSVVLPSCLTTIGENAFAECDRLTGVTFENSQNSDNISNQKQLKNIGTRAFYHCKQFSGFVIPNGVETVGAESFAGTALAGELVLPQTVTYVGKEAFAECEKLTAITVGDRNEIPSEWDADWSNGCEAQVEYKLRVVLNANGATDPLASPEVYLSFNGNYELPVPQKKGYAFAGWYLDDDALTDASGRAFSAWASAEGATLTAKYTANENTLFFNGNGSDAGEMAAQKIATDGTAPLTSNAFAKDGYTFLGWATTAGGEVEYADGQTYTMGAEDSYILYAVWELTENRIVFHGANETDLQTQVLMKNGNRTLQANAFEKESYAFAGWATVKNGNVVYADASALPFVERLNIDLYAVWELNENRIVFHGVNENDLHTQVLAKNGSRNLQANAFEKEGYTFAGWATAKNGTAVYANASSLPFVERLNVDLWAVWTANVNRVVFNGNGATGGSMGEQEIPTDGSAALATNGYTRTGYLFAGWAIEQNGAVQYANGVDYSMGTEPVNMLWAVWTTETYTISYDLDNGTATGNPTTYTIESNAITLINPTREGYKFKGWLGTGLTEPTMQVTISVGSMGVRSYTAVWEAIGKIIFLSDYGEGEMPFQAAYTDQSVLLNANGYTRAGYTFLGWATEHNGAVVYQNQAAFVKTTQEDTYLYAVWGGTEGLQYNIINGYAVVSGYNGTAAKVYIPETYNGYLTMEIGEKAFLNCVGMTSVYIPNTITDIQQWAFENCSGLTSIVIPNSVKAIAPAFMGCCNLTDITIPFVGFAKNAIAGYTHFGTIFGATHSNENASFVPPTLKTVTITGGTSIGIEAFRGCSGLTSIIIPDGVTSIGNNSFQNCTGLQSITIPDSVTSIGKGAFSGCSALESITIPFVGAKAGVTANDTYQYPFGYIFGTDSYTGGTATEQFYTGNNTSTVINTTFYIPSSLKSVTVTGGNILQYAFYGCGGLTSITIPDDVTSIGIGAFINCSGLTSFTIPDSVKSIGNVAFYGCGGLTNITIPDSVTSIGKKAFGGCSSLESITIPFVGANAGVTANDTYQYPFGYIFGTDSYTGGVATKQNYFGSDATSLTFNTIFYIPSSLRSVTVTGGNILYGAFMGCGNLTSITLPDDLTRIESNALNGCSGLTELIIPSTLMSIGDDAFSGCNNLEYIEYDNGYYFGNKENPYFVFVKAKNESITSCNIHENTKIIYQFAFGYCESLKNVTMGNQVVNIGSHAFQSCSNLTSIVLPNSLSKIGMYILNGCRGLNKIYYQGTEEQWNALTGGATNLYYGNPLSITVYYQNGSSIVNGIGTTGLQFSKNVDSATVTGYTGTDTTVVIPSSYDGVPVTAIAAEAFRNCSTITEVYIPDSVTSIGEGAFNGCSSLESMTIPFVGARAGVSSSDANQYPFGYIFGTADYDGGEIISQLYYTDTHYIFSEGYWLPKALKSVTITGGNLLYHAFHNCANIERIIVGDSVAYIDRFAFENCTGMTDVMVGKGVAMIDHATFQNCTGLENVVISDGVLSIGSYAFSGCRSLISITIPNSVTSIGAGAFSSCSSLKSIVIPNSVTIIGEDVFSGCSSLEEITLPFAGKLVDHYESTGCQGYYSFPYMFGTNEYENSKLIQVSSKYFPYGIRSDMVYGGFTKNYYIPIALKRVNICEPNSWLNNIQIEGVEIIWDYTV